MTLSETQGLLYDLITAPRGVAVGLGARGLTEGDLSAVVRSDARLSAVDRVDIYANMYFYRILDVLREEYPRTLAAVGEAAFHDLITDYLLVHRPAHASLREVGAALPIFLAAQASTFGRPWLFELARLERAHLELFDGPDAHPLTILDLRSMAVDPTELAALAVQLVPSHVLVTNAFTLSPVWQLAETRPGSPVFAGVPSLLPEVLLVWRQGLVVRHRAVTDAAEARALERAVPGTTIGALCETLAAPVSEAGEAADAARAFQRLAAWTDDGLLSRAEGPTAR
ncbi:MAG: DNA-binding domain-containing protein [Polyangia bacterium]